MTAAALALCAALFALLLWQVQADGPLVRLDGRVNAGLAPLRNRPLLAAAAWISQVGTGAAGTVLCLVASGFLWSEGRTAAILSTWLAYAGAQATTWPLKFVTARARPHFLDGITAASPSFPSAHATVSMAVYLSLAIAIAASLPAPARPAVYAVAASLILSITASRLLLSLHYLTDVLAGALVGLFWSMLAWHWAP